MRKLLILLALTMMTANSVGCCCCRGLRDWLFQGGSCCPLLAGSTTYAPATYAVAPTYAAPTCAPTCAPTYAPAAAYAAPTYAAPTYASVAPMAATVAAPQYAMPQYTMAAPMATTCGDPCSSGCSPCATSCSPCSGGCSTCGSGCSSGCSTCGASYVPEVGPQMVAAPYVGEPSCSYSDGATPTPAPSAVYPSPAAE